MPTWKDFHPDAIETFQKFRTPKVGEEMILEGNAFVEGVLPSATVRILTDEEMSVYRAPFPQWSYPKLLFAGNPGALVSPAFVESFAKGLKNCRVVQLSSGIHYLQEDHPDVIGVNIKEWLIELGSWFPSKREADIVGNCSDATTSARIFATPRRRSAWLGAFGRAR